MSSHGNHDLGNPRMRRNASTYYSSHSGNHYYTNHHDNAVGNGSYGDDYYYDYYGDFIDYDYPEDRATTTINYVSILILFTKCRLLICYYYLKMLIIDQNCNRGGGQT